MEPVNFARVETLVALKADVKVQRLMGCIVGNLGVISTRKNAFLLH
jgi:hypothetical protein